MRSNLSALLAVLLSLRAAPLFMMAVVVLCGFAAWSPAAIVHYGNDVEFPDSSDHQPDYLLGSKYTVTQPIVLQKVGIIFKDFSIHNFQVGIYTDAGGWPHTLVAETGEFYVYTSGVTETPLLTTPTIPAGDYWFMAVFDAYTSVGVSFGGNSQVNYIDHPFNAPLPATIPAALTYTGQAFNYYLVGETTTSGDYNQDGFVDGHDLAQWRSGFGLVNGASRADGDADGDDDVDGADFLVWQQHVSDPAVPAASVPEPSSLALLILAVPPLLLRRRRSHPRLDAQFISERRI